jgi:hypothetical protein
MVFLTALTALGLTAESTFGNLDAEADQMPESSAIINRYLQASRADSSNASKMGSLDVEIEASVPKLNTHGHLKATRVISSLGKISYKVLGFQGDTSVKNEVIARYLQAEQKGQEDKSLSLSPENYKFKLKGQRTGNHGLNVYVFQLSPRQKRVGLFKGEVWLDAQSYLPVYEKGRLVKNPSVFFRQVDFEREFAILNGATVPARMSSVIDTRLVGKVNLSVAYSSPSTASADEEVVEESTANPNVN